MAQDIPDWTNAVTVEGGTVEIGGTVTATISSGTVDATITNASIPITGSVAISSGTVDIGAGTVDVQNATGTVIETGDAMTQLYAATATRATSFGLTVTRHNRVFGSIAVVWKPTAATGPVPYCVSVDAARFKYQALPALYDALRYTASFGPVTANGCYIAVVPCSALTTVTTNALTLTFYVNKAGSSVIAVYGLTSNPGVLLRPDGRAYPVGSLTATATTSAKAKNVVIAAPASPLRIMLRSLYFYAASTASNAGVGPTGGGTLALLGGGGFVTREWQSGKLLPGGAALVSFATGTGLRQVDADYDLVV